MNTRLICIALALTVIATACGPARLEPQAPQPLPSPAESWSLKLTQTGGFAGVSLEVEVSSDGQVTARDLRTSRSVSRNLPTDKIATLAALYSSTRLLTPQTLNSGCADCFIYDLEARSGGQLTQLHLDDTTLPSSGAAELIHALSLLRDTTLQSQP